MVDTAMKPTADRAYAGNVTLSIGMLSTLGNLYTVTRTNAGQEESFKTVCPECKGPTETLAQKYVCKEDDTHGPFDLADVRYGRFEGDKLIVVDTDKMKEARASIMPEKALELQVHLREEVEGKTFARGNGVYVFKPTGKSPFYGILVELLKKRPDVILLAKTNLRNHDHFVQVDLESGLLVVRDMMFPEDVKDIAPVPVEAISSKLFAQAEMLLDASIEKFEVDEYNKDSRARIAVMVEEATSSAPKGASKKTVKKLADTDMEELLSQALAATKSKKKKVS